MKNKHYEVIVVGLGAVGSAALYQLSDMTSNVLGIDQYAPPHTLGSTHGDTRITRQAIGEGAHFVPLSLRSYQIWEELEALSGESLLTKCGGLFWGKKQSNMLTHNKKGWLNTTIETAQKFDIPHQVLDNDTLCRRFPQFRYQPDDIGYWEENAGFLRPEKCVSVQLAQAQNNGATVHTYEQMLDYRSTSAGVRISTDRGEYHTRTLILTTGAWIGQSLQHTPYCDLLKVYRQVLYWFEVEAEFEKYTPEHLPVYILPDSDIYGFPAIDGPQGGIKIATENYQNPTTPQHINRNVSQAETQLMYERYVAPYLVGVGQRCVKSAVCLYTMTPNGDFLIDRHPHYPQVWLASACSGHGFKHSAAVGQVLAQLALQGKTEFEIEKFQLTCFGELPKYTVN
ncbi:MAG: N-methyl-L-tryptophan oxidase [Runella sp.]